MKHFLRTSLLATMAACILPAGSVVPTTNISVGAISSTFSSGFLQMAVITQPDGSTGIKFWGDFAPFCDVNGCTFLFSSTFTNQLGPDLTFSYDFDIQGNEGDVDLSITSSVDGVIFSDVDTPDSPAWTGSLTVPNGTITFLVQSEGSFTVHVPNNSLDFTPTASAVPEPGSLGLVAGAAALLAVRARRRR